MFESLSKVPADKIFALMGEFKADSRSDKIDLGVGVYKDENGKTPILGSVKKAETAILAEATTKTYVGVPGNMGFCDAVTDLVFADSIDRARVAAVQAPGGTGSLWVLLTLLKRARPNGRIHLSDPTWPNHEPMVVTAGFADATYPYFDAGTGTVRFDDMLTALDKLGPNDIVLLHGCCHNPTGANLTPEQWDAVAASLKRTGAFPFVDLAYLGFGDGLLEDAYGARKLAAELPEMALAFSASKNFGLYRERVGAAITISKDAGAKTIVASQMSNVVRTSYSQPPDHGAEIVRRVLTEPALRAEWEGELAGMRNRMLELRKALAAALARASNAKSFDFVARHRGMFSLLGISEQAVGHLKAKNAVYMLDDSRINVAGLPEDRMDELAAAVAEAVNQ
jgi:aspartate aminotransferase/aromatic-amino-acid transaminase